MLQHRLIENVLGLVRTCRQNRELVSIDKVLRLFIDKLQVWTCDKKFQFMLDLFRNSLQTQSPICLQIIADFVCKCILSLRESSPCPAWSPSPLGDGLVVCVTAWQDGDSLCKVVDGLLLKLNATVYTAQAYADDLSMMIQGKYPSTVADLMQESLRVLDVWCKAKGLSINSEKTEVVLFTRRKTEGVVRLEYQGVKLNFTKQVKLPSVILDNKLMWKAHVREQVKKGLKTL